MQRIRSYRVAIRRNRVRRGASSRGEARRRQADSWLEGGGIGRGVTRYKVLVRLLIMHLRARREISNESRSLGNGFEWRCSSCRSSHRRSNHRRTVSVLLTARRYLERVGCGCGLRGRGRRALCQIPRHSAQNTLRFRVARILVERRPTELHSSSSGKLASNLTPHCKRAESSTRRCFDGGTETETQTGTAG